MRDRLGELWCGDRGLDLGVDGGELHGAGGAGLKVMVEGELGGIVVEALSAHPGVELSAPALGVAGEAAPLAQHEALDALLRGDGRPLSPHAP